MSSYVLSPPAYFKLYFHAAKHPHKSVNGVLLGKRAAGNIVNIEDAVPLLHHWTSLSPMMEIGLDLAGRYSKDVGLEIVGYYQASERPEDSALVPVGEKIANKIKEGFSGAIAFVIDGEKFGTDAVALIPYLPIPSTTSWKPYTDGPLPFTPISRFRLAAEDLPRHTVSLVREERLHQKFGDFDDHLEDVSIDWLRNTACLPKDLQNRRDSFST